MKRTISLLILICLFLSFTGCNTNPAPAADSTPPAVSTSPAPTSDPTVPEATDIVFTQEPMVSVALPITEETCTAEDGALLFSYTYQNMSLITQDPDVGDKVIIDFLNRIDGTFSDAQNVLAAAQAAYPDSENWNPYLYQILFSPTRIDHGVLSLFGSNASYSGGSHPMYASESINYDLVTGEVLSLQDILTEDADIDTLCQLVIEALGAVAAEKSLYSGFEMTVEELFFRDFEITEPWYFSQNGMCFYFSPYEIAPYASGVINAEVPYEKLVGILNDAYFPSERHIATGTVEAVLFEETDLDQFTQIAELILNEGGQKVLLHTDKFVYDVRLEAGSWSANGDLFTPTATVLAAAHLSPGDAIMVEAFVSDTLPNLRLSYQTGDETIQHYICQNAQNNAMVSLSGS